MAIYDRLHAADSADEIVAIVAAYLEALPREALAVFPLACRPLAVTDARDVLRLAEAAGRERSALDAEGIPVHSVFAMAAGIFKIAARQLATLGTHGQPLPAAARDRPSTRPHALH
jgi:hypothetical protein